MPATPMHPPRRNIRSFRTSWRAAKTGRPSRENGCFVTSGRSACPCSRSLPCCPADLICRIAGVTHPVYLCTRLYVVIVGGHRQFGLVVSTGSAPIADSAQARRQGVAPPLSLERMHNVQLAFARRSGSAPSARPGIVSALVPLHDHHCRIPSA